METEIKKFIDLSDLAEKINFKGKKELTKDIITDTEKNDIYVNIETLEIYNKPVFSRIINTSFWGVYIILVYEKDNKFYQIDTFYNWNGLKSFKLIIKLLNGETLTESEKYFLKINIKTSFVVTEFDYKVDFKSTGFNIYKEQLTFNFYVGKKVGISLREIRLSNMYAKTPQIMSFKMNRYLDHINKLEELIKILKDE